MGGTRRKVSWRIDKDLGGIVRRCKVVEGNNTEHCQGFTSNHEDSKGSGRTASEGFVRKDKE